MHMLRMLGLHLVLFCIWTEAGSGGHHRHDGRRAPGEDPPGQASLGHEALGRMSKKQAAVAIANKTARIAWAIMVNGGVYQTGHLAPQYRAEVCAATG